MHSSNGMPENLDTFIELQTSNKYEIRYNRWKTTLLEAPYATNCFKYDMDNEKDAKVRSDCVQKCVQEDTSAACADGKVFDGQQCLIRAETLWRKESLIRNNYSELKLCADIPPGTPYKNIVKPTKDLCVFHQMEKVINKCQVKCKLDCVSRYYNFDVTLKERFGPKDKVLLSDWNRGSLLFIGHNQLPDQITEHIEDMTFVDFFGTFGGLFGVWLGLSAIAIFHFLLNHFG